VHVWIVNHHADPPDGFATRSFDIARRLVERGHPTTVFVSNFNHYRFANVRQLEWRLWRSERIEGVTMVWIRTAGYRGNDWRRIMNMLSFASLAFLAGLTRSEKPAVVIGVTVHPLAALAGYYLARVKRARFLVEVTDLWPETLIQFGRIRRGSISARSLLRLERFLYRKAEKIIMLWRDTGAYVESLGVSSDKIIWLPHGVEMARYATLAPYDGGIDRPFRVVYLGSFVSGMSLETIIDAAAILKGRSRHDIEIDLVGAGTLKGQMIGRVAELGLDNVAFPEPVAKAEIATAMSRSDAFIYGLQDLPLYQYGMSLNKLMDYLASLRPIIFFGKSSYDAVAIAGAGISVPPGDAMTVADAIELMADLDPATRIEMGVRGREYLLKYHTIPALTDRLLAALAEPDGPVPTMPTPQQSAR
jgi:glycosyltransferase involved in cell wall biosynthesis